MPAPTLSVCIPTHQGRARTLERALASVAAQLEGDAAGRVQVCVSDNGSQDGTQEIVSRFREQLGDAFVSHRYEKDQGVTQNLLNVVDIARTDFCWFLGSDDTIEPGGIAAVLAALDAHPDLTGLTANRLHVDDVRPEGLGLDDPQILPPPGRTLYTAAEDVLGDLAMLQDYISTQVVRREAWRAAVAALGSEALARADLFPHVVVLTQMIRSAPKWYWLAEPVVRHRVGAGAITDPVFGGTMSRYTLKVTANRAQLWAEMFGRRSPIYRAAMWRSWLVQANPFILVYYKIEPGHGFSDDVRLLTELTRAYWFLPHFWLRSFPVLLIPGRLVPRSLARIGSEIGRRVRRARRLRVAEPADAG